MLFVVSSERNALAALKASNWNVELAFDFFYSNGGAASAGSAGRSSGRVDMRKLEELYQRYKGKADHIAAHLHTR